MNTTVQFCCFPKAVRAEPPHHARHPDKAQACKGANLWKLYALEKIREELKTDKAAVVGSDSEVYETSHFVPKLFMQSVSAAVLVDSARFVCAAMTGIQQNVRHCLQRESK